YPIVFENDKILAYIKPPGIVTAHQSAKIKSSYSYMKRWMESQNPDNTELNFVNKIDKEATGIAIIAKSLKWRKDLQSNWESYTRRYYILVEGEAHDKGVFDLTTKEDKDTYEVKFRLMRTNGLYSMLRLDLEPGTPDHFEGDLEATGVKMLGHGRMKKSELGYKAKHLFSVNLTDSEGKSIAELKTPVPKAFLKLVK
ncbi:MAG: pseudouridine synthase, partial [Flavobacteriales bacterium]